MNKLFDAVYSSDVITIKNLVTNGYDLKQAFDDEDEGKTPLMTAMEVNSPEVVKLLLDLGADLEQATELRGDTALTWCSKFGTIQNFKGLVSILGDKFDVNCTNAEGNTPLMLAASYGFDDMVLTILEHSPSLQIRNAQGQDVFQIVANDQVTDRSLTREILSMALTQATIKKMKM